MNPFPTRQAAENYLARIPDQAQREATRRRLGLAADEPQPELHNSAILPPPRPVRSTPSQVVTLSQPGTLSFTLPWPPSINHYWRHILVPSKPSRPGAPPYRVQVLISKEGREYRRAVLSLMRNLGKLTTPPEARLQVTLTLCAPTRRAIGIDNRPKAVLDALTHTGVWGDDSLVDELRILRGEVTPGGRVDITITPLTRTLFEDL